MSAGGASGRPEAPPPPAGRVATPEAPASPSGPANDPSAQTAFVVDDELAPMPFIPSWSDADRVRAELEVLRLNVSAHPLAFAREGMRRLRCVPFARLVEVRDGTRIRLAGVLERAQMPWIRSGHRTLFLTLEDETGMAEVVVFNDVFLRYGKLLKETVYLLVEGELQNNDERGLAVVAQRIFDLMAAIRDPGILKRGASSGGRSTAQRPTAPPAPRDRGIAPRGDSRSAGTGEHPPVREPAKDHPWLGPMAPDPRYPAPTRQDHRWPKADPAEGLDDLPVVEPRTRPGRTG